MPAVDIRLVQGVEGGFRQFVGLVRTKVPNVQEMAVDSSVCGFYAYKNFFISSPMHYL